MSTRTLEQAMAHAASWRDDHSHFQFLSFGPTDLVLLADEILRRTRRPQIVRGETQTLAQAERYAADIKQRGPIPTDWCEAFICEQEEWIILLHDEVLRLRTENEELRNDLGVANAVIDTEFG